MIVIVLVGASSNTIGNNNNNINCRNKLYETNKIKVYNHNCILTLIIEKQQLLFHTASYKII